MKSVSELAKAQYLDWDSEFFGVQTARILPRQMDPESLGKVLDRLWSAEVDLVYWASDPSHPESSVAASLHGGLLVDTRCVFGKTLRLTPRRMTSKHCIGYYEGSLECGPELEAIAVDCGKYSRFRSDPRIPNERCAELFRTWIRNSVSRSFADNVIVARDKHEVSGFVTVLAREGVGSIGLLGVGESYRGQGIGGELVDAALSWFATQGCSKASVVTQFKNHAARKLYESNGFYMERTDHFYHFWNGAHDAV